MNQKKNQLFARFAPQTRFALRTIPAAPFRATREDEFEQLKTRLLADKLQLAPGAELNPPLRRAANEAAALAWESNFPLLAFPVLFEEKSAVALRQAERQARIFHNSRELLAA